MKYFYDSINVIVPKFRVYNFSFICKQVLTNLPIIAKPVQGSPVPLSVPSSMTLPIKSKRPTEWFTVLTNPNSNGPKINQLKNPTNNKEKLLYHLKKSSKIISLKISQMTDHLSMIFSAKVSKKPNNGIWEKETFLKNHLKKPGSHFGEIIFTPII